MITIRWLEKRKPYWARLEHLVQRSGNGIATLSHEELKELGLLYRQTASDLGTVREDVSSRQLTFYLNQLLGRSHNLIYMGHKPKVSAIVRFYRDTYPQLFRETLPQTLLAAALVLVTMIAAWMLTLRDPSFAYRLLGPAMIETIEQHHMWTDSIVTIKPLASSGIMTNNLSVAFSMFALGITGGLGTIWMRAVNGWLRGVIERPRRAREWLCNCGVLWRRTACWSCRLFLSPEARAWKLRGACYFRGCCRGALRWRKPADERRGFCWVRFRC